MSTKNGLPTQTPSSQMERAGQRCHILHLHEEIIRKLFDYLPTLRDKVRLACAAPKFRETFDRYAQMQRYTVNVQEVEGMLLPDIINLFKVAGRYVKVLLVNCASYQKESLLVEFIAEYCKNLEEIHYTNVTDEFHYRSIMARLTSLRRVSIDCIDAEDVLALDLEGNVQLESFELVNGCYTGKYLCGFDKLERLVLRDCLLWNSMEFGMPLKGLRALVLDDCCFEVMNQSLYRKIADCCEQLEELTFSGCDANFEIIAQLPNLKHCALKTWMNSNELNLGFLSALAEKKGNKLTYFKLTGQFDLTNQHARCLGQLSSLQELVWCENDNLDDEHFRFFNDLPQLKFFGISLCGRVTDVGLMLLLRKCPVLARIDIKSCDEITEQLVLNAIYFCSKYPERSLILNVEGTQITSSVLQSPDYLKKSNKVKLNFIEVSI